nr:unnamed protein product [Spirometra erinaceieuropaei]
MGSVPDKKWHAACQKLHPMGGGLQNQQRLPRDEIKQNPKTTNFITVEEKSGIQTNTNAILGVLNTFPDAVQIPLRLTRGSTVCASVVSPNRGLFLGTVQSSSIGDTCYDIIFEKPLLANSQLPVGGSTQTSLSVYTVPDEDIFLVDSPSPPSISVCAARAYFLSGSRSQVQNPSTNPEFSDRKFNIMDNGNVQYVVEPLDEIEETDEIHLNSNSCQVVRTSSTPSGLDKCMPTACRLTTHESSLSPAFQPIEDFAGEVDMSNFLISLAKTYRILYQKEKAVAVLKEMNDKVESNTSEDDSLITAEFQHEYATLVLHLDELNRRLRYHIDVVLLHITRMAADYGMPNVACLTDWRRRCEDEAFEMVNRLKTAQGRAIIEESKSVLVAKLTSILTLLTHLQDDKMTNDKLSCIEEVFADIRQRLHPNNLKCFEQSVEQLISHIVLNLSPSILAVQPTATSGQNNYSRHPNS